MICLIYAFLAKTNTINYTDHLCTEIKRGWLAFYSKKPSIPFKYLQAFVPLQPLLPLLLNLNFSP